MVAGIALQDCTAQGPCRPSSAGPAAHVDALGGRSTAACRGVVVAVVSPWLAVAAVVAAGVAAVVAVHPADVLVGD